MRVLLSLCLCFWISTARAYPRTVHVEIEHNELSQGYAAWNDFNILNHLDFSLDNRLIIETDFKSHFGQSAFLGGFNLTHTYTESWYQDFAASFSTNSSILPGWVVFTELHRKLLPERNLVVGLGVGRVQSLQPYSDLYSLLDAVYYVSPFFVLQTDLRFNRSIPGPVDSVRYGIVGTLYLMPHTEISYRFDTGKEGYSLVNAGLIKNQYQSTVQTLQASFSLNSRLGLNLRYENYRTDFYVRNGVSVGLNYAY